MNKNILSRSVFIILVILIYGCSGSEPEKVKITLPIMTNEISKKAGMSYTQSKVGLGVVMMLSEKKLSPEDFAELKKGLPDGDSIISKAESLGVNPDSVNSSADIIKILGNYGVPPFESAGFITEVLKYTKTMGGNTYEILRKVI